MLYPVILCGAAKTQLWPLASADKPKPFLRLFSARTLLQETLLRLQGLQLPKGLSVSAPTFIANQMHRNILMEQLGEIDRLCRQIILEPVARSTAPALTLLALQLIEEEPDSLILALPADHLITDIAAFHEAIRQGSQLAATGYWVTFGVSPWSAHPDYGYIRAGKVLNESASCFKVSQFIEKPHHDLAERFIEQPGYFWNSGMYLFSAHRLIAEMEKFHPEIVAACKKTLEAGFTEGDFLWLDEPSYKDNPTLSIDYAISEKTAKAAMVSIEMGWSDLGTWSLLEKTCEKDVANNVIHGDVLLDKVRDSYIHAEDGTVVALGVENMIIVKHGDTVLVTSKENEEDIAQMVSLVKHHKKTAIKPVS